MKNLNLLINIVLVAAVTTLFAMHFASERKSGSSTSSADHAVSTGELNIVFVNADSLTQNYELYKDEFAAAAKRTSEAEERFTAEQRKFEKEANEFQQRAQFLTITERESKQERLVKKQQELMQLEQQLSADLQRQEGDVSQRIFQEIDVFLKEYAEKQGYTYILSYAKGGGVWYAAPQHDITPEVLKELNERYKKQKTE